MHCMCLWVQASSRVCVRLLVLCDKRPPLTGWSSSPLLPASHPITRGKGTQQPSTNTQTHTETQPTDAAFVISVLEVEILFISPSEAKPITRQSSFRTNRRASSEGTEANNYVCLNIMCHWRKKTQTTYIVTQITCTSACIQGDNGA